MKKGIWILIILIIAVVAVIWAMGSGTSEAPIDDGEGNGNATSTATSTDATEGTEDLGDDATSSINDQLEGINPENVEDEFNDINKDMENL